MSGMVAASPHRVGLALSGAFHAIMVLLLVVVAVAGGAILFQR